jgi:radical SAM superfamily enzyme YgiQ (UPF0313 family)
MIREARLLDASADDMSREDVLRVAAGYELVVIHTGTATFENDASLAADIREAYPGMVIGMVGPHVTVAPEESLKASEAADFIAIGEFDDTVVEVAQGRPLDEVRGLVYRYKGSTGRTAPRPPVENLDRLPFVSEVYARDLHIENYFIGYLKHPYVSIYAGRGCRGRCTYCLWPQTIGGGTYRVRSAENIYEEMRIAKALSRR